MKVSYISLSFVAAVLGFVVFVQTGLVSPKVSGKTPRKSLHQSLPGNLPGWSVKELPIGPTEMDRTTISELLRYDDVVFRQYESARGKFCLYAAYWAPQTISPNLIGGHTPDRCWVGSGWTCEAASFSWESKVGDQVLFPAQHRTFRDGRGRVEQVIYWHLVGGTPFDGDYRIDGSRSILAYWKAILYHHSGGNTEQYFIRLNSERSFEEIWDDPGFRSLMESLARLCLARRDG